MSEPMPYAGRCDGGGHWSTTHTEIWTASGNKLVMSYVHPAARGLAVTYYAGAWSITHVDSGTAITNDKHGAALMPLLTAQEMTLRLGAIGDWDRGAIAIIEDVAFRKRVVPVIRLLDDDCFSLAAAPNGRDA